MTIKQERIVWIIERLGLPTFFTLVLLFGMYKSLNWMSESLFQPIVVRHIKFIDKLEENDTKQHEADVQKIQLLSRQGEILDRQSEILDKVYNATEKILVEIGEDNDSGSGS